MELMRTVHNSACFLCMFLNILLTYLIVKRTPRELKSYSILMLVESVMNTTTACLSLMVFYRIMSTKEYMLGAIAGPCAYTGSAHFCFSLCSIMLCGHSNHCMILAFSSRYRYHQLQYSTVPAKYLFPALIIAMTPGFVIFAGFATSKLEEGEQLVELFHTVYPNYNATTNRELMIGTAFSPPTTLASMWLRVVFIPTYSIVIISIVQINRQLSALKMNERSRALHKQVVKGLTVQSMFPLTYASGLLVYILRKQGIIEDSLDLQFLSLTLAVFNITFSALSTIFFIKPYWRAVISLFLPNYHSQTVVSFATGKHEKTSSRFK